MSDDQVARLERQIQALKKVNAVLIARVEKSVENSGDAYSLFEKNLVLQKSVDERTQELNQRNMQLQQTLSDLQGATEQLIQSEKLAALGSLVAGIAHEVNTPLGVSLTAASLLDQNTADFVAKFNAGTMKKSDLTGFVDGCRETVNVLMTNLARAADLIQSFKRIAVDQSHDDLQTIDMASYLRDIMHSLSPALKKTRIVVDVECPADIRVYTSPGSLTQVVSNLVHNAILHAYEPGEEGRVMINVRMDGRQGIVLVCTDFGKGIAAENLPRIFDPFFTTRRGSGGSGLGLHLIFNIVSKGLKGSIHCESTPGSGSRFVIGLPDCLRTSSGN